MMQAEAGKGEGLSVIQATPDRRSRTLSARPRGIGWKRGKNAELTTERENKKAFVGELFGGPRATVTSKIRRRQTRHKCRGSTILIRRKKKGFRRGGGESDSTMIV